MTAQQDADWWRARAIKRYAEVRRLKAAIAAVEFLHDRVPSDSPFNGEGRDVCSTCMDGIHQSDYPCATIIALTRGTGGVV